MFQPVQESAPQGESRDDLAERFRRLAHEWKVSRKATSSAKRMAEHPAYREIIAMGRPAMPLIIAELERELDHWFIALHAITGASPVPETSRGKLPDMARAWIEWWRRNSV